MAEATDGAEHFLHGRRFADDFRGARLAGWDFQALLLLGVLEGALDQRHGLVHVERLGQVLEGAALVGGHRAVQVGMGGHDDDR
ncbi:hypothetical protein D3C84_234190 [compost metagenome]